MATFKKSFVLVRKPTLISLTENDSTSYSSKRQNQNQTHKLEEQVYFHDQTSTELLETILKDIQNIECHKPFKKIKTEKNSSIYSSTSLVQVGGCNCKKTKCLKLYCQCFSSGGYCKPGCSCLQCSNNFLYENQRASAIEQILLRQSKAFSLKDFKQNQEQFKGCNCKKSECLKKYCQCFNYGIGCSQYCKCESCKNNKSKSLIQKQLPLHKSISAYEIKF